MARPLRIEFPGAVYHVTSRGDRGEPIFVDDKDRQGLLGVVAQALSRFDAETLSYCLMDNHYHFVLHTRQANLSLLMRHINGVYTQSFNRRHDKVGHLFQCPMRGGGTARCASRHISETKPLWSACRRWPNRTSARIMTSQRSSVESRAPSLSDCRVARIENSALQRAHAQRHDYECDCPRAWVVDFPREPIDCSGGRGKMQGFTPSLRR